MFRYPYYSPPVVFLSGYSIPRLAFQGCPLLTTLEQVAQRCSGLMQGDLFLWMTLGNIHRVVQRDGYSSAFGAVAGLPLEPGGNKHDTYYNQSGWWRNPNSHSCLVQLTPLVSAVLLYFTLTGILCSWQLTREIFPFVSERTVQGSTVNCLEVMKEDWRSTSSPASLHPYVSSRCVWFFIRGLFCVHVIYRYTRPGHIRHIYVFYIYLYVYIYMYICCVSRNSCVNFHDPFTSRS